MQNRKKKKEKEKETKTMGFLLVCMSCLLFMFICSYVFQLVADGRRRLPPGPRPLPLIGNLLDVAGELPHRSLARLAKRHGPLMTVRLGTLVTIVASSPSAAREVLQTHNGSLTGRSPPDAWHALGHAANSVFVLPPGRRWRTLRRIGAEHLLSARQLDGSKRLRSLLRDAALGLVRRVSDQAAAAPVEVGRAACTATLEMQWRALFSAGLDGAASRALRDAAWEAVMLSLMPNASDFFPALAAADLQGVRRRFARAVAVVYRMIDEQIERREAAAGSQPAGEKDLLDVMLDVSSSSDDGAVVTMDTDAIRTFLTDIFMASVVPIPSAVEWAMAELLQHPDAMRRLQEELRGVLMTGSDNNKPAVVEHSDVERLPYLRAVVRETLRLHPVVPLLLNEAEETVEIQGHAVPKGCAVLVNLWAVHRDPGVWPEPDRFMPERFLPRLEADGGGIFHLGTPELDFIPFSAGRRACLGQPLAARMVHTMLGSLLLRFEWALLPDVKKNGLDMSEGVGLTTTMAAPLQAIATSV